MDPSVSNLLLMAHVLATVYMTGVIWFVQVVHYPLFALVGQAEFTGYEARHVRRTGWVVGPPMILEAGTGLALVFVPSLAPYRLGLGVSLAVLAAIWISTIALQVPAHRTLEAGFDANAHRRLVASNWIRTAGWTLRSLLVIGVCAGMVAAP